MASIACSIIIFVERLIGFCLRENNERRKIKLICVLSDLITTTCMKMFGHHVSSSLENRLFNSSLMIWAMTTWSLLLWKSSLSPLSEKIAYKVLTTNKIIIGNFQISMIMKFLSGDDAVNKSTTCCFSFSRRCFYLFF